MEVDEKEEPAVVFKASSRLPGLMRTSHGGRLVSSAETEREASKNGNGKRREVDPGTPEAKIDSGWHGAAS